MRFFNIKRFFFQLTLSLIVTISHAAPVDIEAIFNKPLYKNAKWGLRVIDSESNKELININPIDKFFIGSVRKIFSVGELLNAVGPQYRLVTTVHTDGKIDQGDLKGNLILVASGDLTMGGRTKPNGEIAITDYDHNEADSLGNAQLTKPNPLAGYKQLAKQVKEAGVNKISGDVVIDERLFDSFDFRGEFVVSPIFVNDDVIDVIINPSEVNKKAKVEWQPHSSGFNMINQLKMTKPGVKYNLNINPEIPNCFGKSNCVAEINGQLPINFIPPLTNKYPLIQTIRISNPANYARTVFIEALREAGVDISKLDKVKNNPVALLKSRDVYNLKNQVAALQSLPYAEYAKFILKVSYNIGADTSLVLFGLTQGVRSMSDSLQIERKFLQSKYNISADNFNFVDGSGGGDTLATNTVITNWLQIMTKSSAYQPFFHALPILGVDGSLVFVKDFQSNSSLSGARGRVHAKTGTYVKKENNQMMLKGQSLAGYVTTKNNHKLIFQVVVNEVPINSINDVLQVFQDQGTISAILWRDF